MTPYQPGQDLFQTSADTRFNSFTDPSALAMNQQNGQWGVNPNLLTPAYTASYRPSFNGYQGNSFGAPTPGFGQSVNQLFNPFAGGGVNYGGNTYQQQSPFSDGVAYSPVDHAANFTQKWVVPGMASWLSYKFLSKPLGEGANRFASGIATGLARGSFSAAQTATIGRAAGTVGGLAGSMFLPAVAAEIAVHAADKLIFDPYVAQRQMASGLRRNFAGITFSDGSGNDITGRGFSRVTAGRQAASISQLAARDYSFNQSEYANLTDLSARAGLLDTVQGGQVAERMKLISKQVKTVMQIGNTSDFKEAVETIAKLQMSGVNHKDISNVYSKLGSMASVAGVSVQKMMATVGAQGEYLFGANGLNPYGGQLAAGNAYAAFSVAKRNGLISEGALARMGGLDGATQSATSGLLNMAQTPYAAMAAMNKYIGGGSKGNVVGDVSKFGGFISQDVLNNTGIFNFRRGELASKSLEEDGVLGQLKQLVAIAKVTPTALNKDGSVKGGAAYQILTQQMGLSDQEAHALITQQVMAQDPKNLKATLAGIESGWQETRLKLLEQNGEGSLGAMVMHPFKEAWHSTEAATSRFISDFMEPVHKLGDAYDEWNMKVSGSIDYNPAGKKGGKSLNLTYKKTGKRSLADEQRNHENFRRKDTRRAFEALKDNEELIAAIEKGDRDEIARVVANAAIDGKIDRKYLASEHSKQLVSQLQDQSITTTEDTYSKTSTEITDIKDKVKADDLLKLNMEIGNSGGHITKEQLARFNSDNGSAYTMDDTGKILNRLATVSGIASGKKNTKMYDYYYDKSENGLDNYQKEFEALREKTNTEKHKDDSKEQSSKSIISGEGLGLQNMTIKGDTNISSQGTINLYVTNGALVNGNTGKSVRVM